MFDIFVKRKKVSIDFFTSDELAYNYGKPVKATKVLPRWFTEMDSTYPAEDGQIGTTIKKCPGIISMHNKSIALTSWFEFSMQVEPSGQTKVNFGQIQPDIVQHNKQQFEPFVRGTNAFSLKINSPWFLKFSRDMMFTLTEPSWYNYKLFDAMTLMPGILESKYTNHPNLNFIVRPGAATKKLFIEPGDPIGLLTPLTEDDVEIHTHVVSESELVTRGLKRVTWGLAQHEEFEENKEKDGYRYHKRMVDKLEKLHNEDDKL